jgi:hypothetical protein
MRLLKITVAYIVTICILLIVDLIVNYVLSHTTEWRIFNETWWRILVSIGKFSLGWFYGVELYKDIYKKLEN